MESTPEPNLTYIIVLIVVGIIGGVIIVVCSTILTLQALSRLGPKTSPKPKNVARSSNSQTSLASQQIDNLDQSPAPSSLPTRFSTPQHSTENDDCKNDAGSSNSQTSLPSNQIDNLDQSPTPSSLPTRFSTPQDSTENADWKNAKLMTEHLKQLEELARKDEGWREKNIYLRMLPDEMDDLGKIDEIERKATGGKLDRDVAPLSWQIIHKLKELNNSFTTPEKAFSDTWESIDDFFVWLDDNNQYLNCNSYLKALKAAYDKNFGQSNDHQSERSAV